MFKEKTNLKWSKKDNSNIRRRERYIKKLIEKEGKIYINQRKNLVWSEDYTFLYDDGHITDIQSLGLKIWNGLQWCHNKGVQRQVQAINWCRFEIASIKMTEQLAYPKLSLWKWPGWNVERKIWWLRVEIAMVTDMGMFEMMLGKKEKG